MIDKCQKTGKEGLFLLERFRKKDGGPKTKEYFTIMILPGPNSKVRKFSISKPLLKNIAIFLLVAFAVSTAMLVQYFHMQGQVCELDSLRAETVQHREELKQFACSLVDFKGQMDKIKELDFKLRRLANMPGESKEQQLPGIGGSRESSTFTLEDIGRKSHRELMDQMKLELDSLSEDIASQESSMNKLTEFFEHRNSVLAATPSIWPVRGFITSTFGYRSSPISGKKQFHEGLDIANNIGTKVVAPANGTVADTGYQSGYGRFIKIQHGYGMVTVYGHLSKVAVKSGQRVARGEVIGYVGNTGSSTGPHLHYEVRVNGVPNNPRKFL